MVWWLLAVVFGVWVLWRVAVGVRVARSLPALLSAAGFEGRVSPRAFVAVCVVASVGAWLPLGLYLRVLGGILSDARRAELLDALRAALSEVVERFALTRQGAALTPA